MQRQTPKLDRKSELCIEKRKLNKRIKRLLEKYTSDQDMKLGTLALGKKISDFVLKAKNCRQGSEDFKNFHDTRKQIEEAKIRFPEIRLLHEDLFLTVSKMIIKKNS